MAAEDRTIEMRQRFWRHITTSMAGALGAIVLAGGTAAIVGTFGNGGTAGRVVIGLAIVSCLAISVGVGWWSTFRNLRCPGCDAAIWWQVSWNMSLFGRRASKHCNHCGVRLFDERSGRFVLVLMVVAFMLGIVGAVLNVATHH